MQVDLQALEVDVRANSYPFFTSANFDSKFEKGWIGIYQYFVRFLLLFTFVNIIVNGIAGRIYIEEYIETTITYNSKGYPEYTPTFAAICYAYSCFVFAALGLLLFVGIYMMGYAMTTKNLAKQDSALKIFTFHCYFHLATLSINYFLGPKKNNRTTGVYCITIFADLSLGLGLLLKIVAHRIRDEMVDKPDSMMLKFYDIAWRYPRFFSDIERRPLRKDDAPL